MTLAVAAVLVTAPPIEAQESTPAYQPSADYQQCMRQDDAARGIAAAVDVCLGLEQTIQIERLDTAFGRAFDRVTGWDQVRLYNDQVEWRAGLDQRCADAVRNEARVSTDSRAFNICRLVEMAGRAAMLDDYEAE